MDNLRRLQLVVLDILKEFIRICEEHDLRYFASDGTALGAVRHKGFIPWDDDIDVMMPREDYERLFDIAKDHLSDGFVIESKFSEFHGFVRIKSDKAVVSTGNAIKDYETDAYLDVFPVDGLPNSKIFRYVRLRTSLFTRALFHISVFRERVDQVKKRPFAQRVIVWLCNKIDLQRLFNKDKRIAAYEKIFIKYSFYKSDYCFAPWSLYHLKAVWKTEWFGEGVKLPFENIEIVVPTNYDSFLSQTYGNYMELPPENERNHHGVKGIRFNEDVENGLLESKINL